jgi:hypothetical protein
MNYQKLLTAFLFLPLMTSWQQSQAQTALPYFSGFDSDAQKTGWQEFRKGVTTQFNKWTYAAMDAYTAPNCLRHDYPVGGTDTTKNWFVSPPFNLSSGGKIDSLRYAFTGFGVPGPGDTVAVYLLKGNADPALATSKTLLYDFRGANYVGDNTWRNLTTVTLPASSGSSYIAIYYRTVNNWLDVKFDNVRISSSGTTGIGQTALSPGAVVLYPNPATETVQLKTKEHFTRTCIYDLSGKIVYQETFNASLPVSRLATGQYIITCTTATGQYWKQQFVKR